MDASAGVLRGYPLVPETATLIEAQLTPDAPADVIGPASAGVTTLVTNEGQVVGGG